MVPPSSCSPVPSSGLDERGPTASGLVNASFIVHPLRVESVAWITQRKDVLCEFFGLFAIAAHVRYVANMVWWWDLAVLYRSRIIGACGRSAFREPFW